jgi:LmbE family N-acetylglucosaminyl deacetylase
MSRITHILLLLVSMLVMLPASAQRNLKSTPPMRTLNASEIQIALKSAQVLGSVLYVAAHPDDENTRLIAYLTNGRGIHSTYLSLTRGDGGQNLLGTEIGPSLGLLRSQELLAARNIDGSNQRFSRAIDFGYSKGPGETLEIWDREAILGDVVMTIRQLQPDVIITRFPGPEDGGGGHGHHTSSFILAKEAFSLAADKNYRPELGNTWQATRLMWNNWLPFWRKDYDATGLLKMDIGAFDPLLGMSYGEMADMARSQHKCQDFGANRRRGSRLEYLENKAGDEATEDLMDNIDVSWNRLPGGEKVGEHLANAEKDFNPANPQAILPHLLEAYKIIKRLPDSRWKSIKEKEVADLIINCSGLWFEALTDEPTSSPGDSLGITTFVLNRMGTDIECQKVDYYFEGQAGNPISLVDNAVKLDDNTTPMSDERKIMIPKLGYPYYPTQPYWLAEEGQKGVYAVGKQELIGLPETPAPLMAAFAFGFKLGDETVTVDYTLPAIHKYVDRAVGELYRSFVITPRMTINIGENVYLFGENKAQEMKLLVKSHSNRPVKGKMAFQLPEGWNIEPATIELDFDSKGKEMPVSVKITPPNGQSVGKLIAMADIDGELSSYGFSTIEYDHIPTQLMFPRSFAKLVKVDFEKKGENIAYIMGSGDEVPQCLQQVGYNVTMLDDDDITLENLRQYDAVIAGIRAYNRRQRLPFLQDQIFKYIEEGGTYIVQYNKSRGMLTQSPAPYPIKLSRDRVTVEEAPIKMLVPDHPIFNSPNKITSADFDGWIQERGLYFPNEWDENFVALTECNDPGEDPKQGALLVAEYGKGHYIYTGYSWFRELPAGVPGAYRIFANMLSLGN